jgi:hypothetical protein
MGVNCPASAAVVIMDYLTPFLAQLERAIDGPIAAARSDLAFNCKPATVLFA